MNVKLTAGNIGGKVEILSSKSELHRLLILSALADKPTTISYSGILSKDVCATISCLSELGSQITVQKDAIIVNPLVKTNAKPTLDCGESGSTLRFILPLVCALGVDCKICVQGRLSQRPLSPLYELLQQNGVDLTEQGDYPMFVSGKLKSREFCIDGSVSSQFITGLLMALAVDGNGGCVEVSGVFESKPYVDITVRLMHKFGVKVVEKDNVYTVSGKVVSPSHIVAGGDWSNGAFFASLGAISGSVSVGGLDILSAQGDKAICEILKQFGAIVEYEKGVLTVSKNSLKGIKIDASDIPDLVPVLAVVACFAQGETHIFNASRLRLKESDRIASVVAMINGLGGSATELADGIKIVGKPSVCGGVVDSANDHRIVMSATVASALATCGVTILNAQAVSKSYPDFFEQVKKLGICAVEV